MTLDRDLSERDFRGKVDDFIKTLPSTFAISVQQRAIRGDADKILCVNGHFVWLELKKERGVADPLQLHKRDKVLKANGLAFICKPSNYDSIKTMLTLLAEGKKK